MYLSKTNPPEIIITGEFVMGFVDRAAVNPIRKRCYYGFPPGYRKYVKVFFAVKDTAIPISIA